MVVKAGIFILTQNTPERKIYLKTTLYFLFRHFNKIFNYPIIILHEKDYDVNSQNEIIQSIRENSRHLISFKKIDDTDFQLPSHIDEKKVEKIVELQPVPYWRNMKYRQMCYFWIKHFFKYTDGFDYVMRLDDDSFIEEPITSDVFETMMKKDLVYASNIVHVDCGICNFGMKELFEEALPQHKDKINSGLFIQSKLTSGNDHFNRFKKVVSIVNDCDSDVSEYITNMPLMYYNNFFVTSTNFWKQNDVRDLIDKIDKHGGIFYYRYGDAPIQTLIVSLLVPEKITRTVFRYSKRLQREVFVDNSGCFHSYMPKTYDCSSCIIKK